MAKKIKAIQCPQCGSAQQSKIKEDHYRCGSCGAEYFLDNDDINVNIKHEMAGGAQTPPLDPAKVGKVIMIVVAFVLLFVTVLIIIKSSDKTATPEYVNERFTSASIAHASSKPIAFTLSKRTYRQGYQNSEDARNGYYFAFYDIEANTILKDFKIENISFSAHGSEHYYNRYFENINKELVIINKTNILEIDFENLTYKDITTDLLGQHSEFNAGIATVEFESKHRGEGLKIVTNLGKNFTYFPAMNYLRDNDIRKEDPSQNSGEYVEKDLYMFTKKSIHFPDMPIQLMKLNYQYHTGGLNTKPYSLEWKRDYYAKVKDAKMLDFNERNAKVISFEDFTPERYYFNPTVLYQTVKTLLIQYNPTVSPDAPLLFQLLNLETKEPIWTKPFPPNKELRFTKDVGLTDKYYVFHENYINFHLIPLTEDGEIVSVNLSTR